MEIVVKHKELNEVAKNMDVNAEKMDVEIDKLLNDINNLSNIWQGKDSNIFCEKVKDYLDNLRDVPYTYRVLDNFIERADRSYKEIDDSYAESLERLGDYYE